MFKIYKGMDQDGEEGTAGAKFATLILLNVKYRS